MEEWRSIRMDRPLPPTIDGESPGLVVIQIPLAPVPDEHWVEFFKRGAGVKCPKSMRPPTIDVGGTGITIRPRDDEIEKYIHHVQERVDAANAEWDRIVRPRLEREHRKALEVREERKRRIAEAQEKIDEMFDGGG